MSGHRISCHRQQCTVGRHLSFLDLRRIGPPSVTTFACNRLFLPLALLSLLCTGTTAAAIACRYNRSPSSLSSLLGSATGVQSHRLQLTHGRLLLRSMKTNNHHPVAATCSNPPSQFFAHSSHRHSRLILPVSTHVRLVLFSHCTHANTHSSNNNFNRAATTNVRLEPAVVAACL